MAQIPNSVPLTGLVAPTDDKDDYAVIDPIYGIDGLRSVQDLAARDVISMPRRREGMLVYTRSDKKYWQLGPDLSNAAWQEFRPGPDLPPDPPAEAFRWCIQDNTINESIEVGPNQTFLHANTTIGPGGHVQLTSGAELKIL